MKKLRFFNKHVLLLVLSCFLAFDIHAVDGPQPGSPGQGQAQPAIGGLSGFVRERVCGLYHITSVTGHGSHISPASEFLKLKFKEGWSIGEVKYRKQNLPSPADKQYKDYDRLIKEGFVSYKGLLDIREDQSEADVELIDQSATYQYLYKFQNQVVTIIFLEVVTDINFALKDRKSKLTYEQLLTETDRQYQVQQTFSPKILAASGREYEARLAIIKVDFDSKLTQDEKAIKLEPLESQEKAAKDEQDQLNAQRTICDETLSTLRVDLRKHILLKFPQSCIYFSHEGFHSDHSEALLQHIQTCFPGNLVEIYTLLSSEEDSSSNIASRLISATSYSGDPYIGHFCHARITINPTQSSLNVGIIDPTFDAEQPYLKPVFGSKDPLPTKSLNFFTNMASSLNLKLTHTYHYRNDQIINFHDCGRFAMIYLLADLEGRSVLKLTNYEIYRGFKILEAYGFDLIHQTKTLTNAKPNAPSWFARFVSGPRRFFCDLTMKICFGDPFIPSQTSDVLQALQAHSGALSANIGEDSGVG